MSKSHKKGGSGHRNKNHGHGSDHVEPTQWQTLNIIVHRGDPVDARSTRHTAFFIEFPDGSNVLSHVIGAYGFFEFEERWNTAQPSESRHFERQIPVVTAWSHTARDLTIRNTIYNTPVNNTERGWNCQSWIGDGLRMLQQAELIPAASITDAADRMA